jgi:hypothetical protein
MPASSLQQAQQQVPLATPACSLTLVLLLPPPLSLPRLPWRRLRCFWRKCFRICSWRRPPLRLLLRLLLLRCHLPHRLPQQQQQQRQQQPALLTLTRRRASSAWTRRAAWRCCRASTWCCAPRPRAQP